MSIEWQNWNLWVPIVIVKKVFKRIPNWKDCSCYKSKLQYGVLTRFFCLMCVTTLLSVWYHIYSILYLLYIKASSRNFQELSYTITFILFSLPWVIVFDMYNFRIIQQSFTRQHYYHRTWRQDNKDMRTVPKGEGERNDTISSNKHYGAVRDIESDVACI